MDCLTEPASMTDHKNRKRHHEPDELNHPTAPLPEMAAEAPPPDASEALIDPAENAVTRLEEEVGSLKDKLLRLAAEYDNFRKRTIKERGDSWAKAQADLVQRLVDAFDDLSRFAHVDPAQTDAKTIHDGVDMVERKIWKVLDGLGVKRIDQIGVPFDPRLHEAVTTAPADRAEADHTVGAILQPGYALGEALIRPARVQVLTWQAESQLN